MPVLEWRSAQPPTLPRRYRSTLGAESLHVLVRDGAAWATSASTRASPHQPAAPSVISMHILASPIRLSRAPSRWPRRPAPRAPPTRGSRDTLGYEHWWALPFARPPPPASGPVVSRMPLGAFAPWRTHLVAGFPLRCCQRFSVPDVATQPCRLPHNWSTSGPSSPVLSY